MEDTNIHLNYFWIFIFVFGLNLRDEHDSTISLPCSLNWQHQLCKNPKSNPDIKTLFVDHTCGQQNGARAPSPVTNHLIGPMHRVGGFPPMGGPPVSENLFDVSIYW